MHTNFDKSHLNSYVGKEILGFDFVSKDDFIVDEIGLEWKGNGNFLILHIQKVEMTTWDMIAAFAKFLDINAEKIGYAGLKDKDGLTVQWISVPRKFREKINKF